MGNREKGRIIVKFALLFFFSSAYYYLFLRVLWRVGDEGILVYGAQLVAQGGLPYRDFFEVMGPGSFYWLGLFFKLFGIHILVARGLLLLTGSLTIVLLYWMTRRLYQGPFETLPALFFMIISIPWWPATSHHWDSIFFALLALATFLLWQDKGRRSCLLTAGFLSGFTSCFLQQKGLLLVLTFLLVLWVHGLRTAEPKSKIISHSGILIAGYAMIGILVILLFHLAGGLSDLIYANLIWPLSYYRKVNSVPYAFGLFNNFWPSFKNTLQLFLPSKIGVAVGSFFMFPLIFIATLPILLLIMAAVLYATKLSNYRAFESGLLPFWGAGLALWISELQRKDIIHLVYGSPLLLIIIFVLWNRYCLGRNNYRKIGLNIITFCLLSVGIFNAITALSARQEFKSRRGIIWTHEQDNALKFLHEHFQAKEEVFIYPYYSMYYFLSDLKNPTRYGILLYNYNTEGQFKEAINSLEKKKVKYILWDTLVENQNIKIWFPNYQLRTKEQMDMENYFESHYEIVDIKNRFRILRRRDLPEAIKMSLH